MHHLKRTEDTWLVHYAENATLTDQLTHKGKDHVMILGLGLMGEAGSISSEVKKKRREGDAYPDVKEKLKEEIGDFLWYFVRTVTLRNARLLTTLSENDYEQTSPHNNNLNKYLDLGVAVGQLLQTLQLPAEGGSVKFRSEIEKTWTTICRVARGNNISMSEAAGANVAKREDRWQITAKKLPIFDEKFPSYEQLPRHLSIEFIERSIGKRTSVVLSSKGINIGDSLTDNIQESDEYRYHDVFHLGYLAFLAWSPVFRRLLKLKRKSNPSIDENEDGARASIIEEAISAMVFSHAKRLEFFKGIDHLDYDVLKNIKALVSGYEVEAVPLWQWEKAILRSYEVFRMLKSEHGGTVICDIPKRRLGFSHKR